MEVNNKHRRVDKIQIELTMARSTVSLYLESNSDKCAKRSLLIKLHVLPKHDISMVSKTKTKVIQC